MNKLKRWWRVRWMRFVSWLGLGKVEVWSSRDQMLMDQWWAAYVRGNIEEMERLQELINKNWRDHRYWKTLP